MFLVEVSMLQKAVLVRKSWSRFIFHNHCYEAVCPLLADSLYFSSLSGSQNVCFSPCEGLFAEVNSNQAFLHVLPWFTGLSLLDPRGVLHQHALLSRPGGRWEYDAWPLYKSSFQMLTELPSFPVWFQATISSPHFRCLDDQSLGKWNVIMLFSLSLSHSSVHSFVKSFSLSVGPLIASLRRHFKFPLLQSRKRTERSFCHLSSFRVFYLVCSHPPNSLLSRAFKSIQLSLCNLYGNIFCTDIFFQVVSYLIK